MIPIQTPPGGRALFWVLVLACLIASTTALGARLATRAANLDAARAQGALVLRITAPEDAAAITRAATIARGSPGIYRAEPMTPERAADLLKRFGADAPGALPPLRLIEVDAAPNPAVRAELQSRLAAEGIEAELIGGAPPTGANDAALAIENAARLLFIAAALAAAALAWLVGMARAASGSAAVSTLVDLGATRGQVMAAFGFEAAGAAFSAGVVAALTLGAGILALRYLGSDPALALLLAQMNEFDYAPMAAAPIAATLLAWLGARTGASGAYARAAVKP